MYKIAKSCYTIVNGIDTIYINIVDVYGQLMGLLMSTINLVQFMEFGHETIQGHVIQKVPVSVVELWIQTEW